MQDSKLDTKFDRQASSFSLADQTAKLFGNCGKAQHFLVNFANGGVVAPYGLNEFFRVLEPARDSDTIESRGRVIRKERFARTQPARPESLRPRTGALRCRRENRRENGMLLRTKTARFCQFEY